MFKYWNKSYKTNSATTNYPTNNLSTKFNINPNVSVPINLGNVKGDAKFIPQHMLKGLTGQAAGYAISRGDYFGGVTFLSEGVRSNAFLLWPASGAKGKGTLVNTHPGITLTYQTDKEIVICLVIQVCPPLTEEILRSVRGGTISPNMRNSQLRVGDYYNMFKHVQDKYTAGANNALMGVMQNNPFAKKYVSSR